MDPIPMLTVPLSRAQAENWAKGEVIYLNPAMQEGEIKNVNPDDEPPLDKVYILRDDFLREYGKYMLHRLRVEWSKAEEDRTELEKVVVSAWDHGDLTSALAASEQAKISRSRADAFNLAISMLITSARGLGIDPEELNL